MNKPVIKPVNLGPGWGFVCYRDFPSRQVAYFSQSMKGAYQGYIGRVQSMKSGSLYKNEYACDCEG